MNQTVSDYRFKFSVVTAVYNVEPYLAEAIESILTQDIGFEESVEIILVDDGSTDRSSAICDEYQQKFPDNIKVIHKENGGAASARNTGISHCEGQYISFMDADDRLTSSTLSDVYGFFSTCDANIPFVSVPIYFFEKRDFGHRLNYKYECESSRIIDLVHEYSFIQMSASSAFFRHKIIQEGDLVKIDAGLIYKGYHSDAARTYAVGEVSPEAKQLMEVTKQSFFEGIKFAKAGNHLNDVSKAIGAYAAKFNYGIVRDLVGHGIGTHLHEDPQIPNFPQKRRGIKLMPGMTLAIEPMINLGRADVAWEDDEWTVVTMDGSLSAHYENTILITDGEPEILTLTK